jgi:hypothetical protein
MSRRIAEPGVDSRPGTDRPPAVVAFQLTVLRLASVTVLTMLAMFTYSLFAVIWEGARVSEDIFVYIQEGEKNLPAGQGKSRGFFTAQEIEG